ncbi:MAG: indolepyruvate oxidoreductase subunit beta [Eggerthellaceae bacterium]|nr:indolepyruvate oxidoreductase subunit beta [Eggerthellaceae bacterium]
MISIMLTGVGGQGTVLAAKVLAQAAQEKGWHVRTAETIGMAQRGGSVVSHVRMGDEGEEVYSPLIARQTANMIIAFEPAEGARMLPYLACDGVLVTATTAVQPVTAALSKDPYRGERVIDELRNAFADSPERLIVVDDEELLGRVGNRRTLNTVLLAKALATGRVPLDIADLREAIRMCVKPAFVNLNLHAIDVSISE